MKKLILGILTVTTMSFSATAQYLSNCKKICETQKLVEEGPFLGIRFNVLPRTNKSVIYEVFPNTAASGIGLQPQDLILELDGKSPSTNKELIDIIGAHEPGDVIKIVYNRAGVIHEKKVRIGAKSTRMVTVKECCEENVVIDEVKQIIFDLSPNPADTKITLRANQPIDGNVEVKIFDLYGKVIDQFQKNNRGQFEMPIDVSTYINGEYIAKVTTKDNTFSARFIVAH